MLKTKMSSKGQVVIPKTVRRSMRLAAGAEFAVREDGGEIHFKPTCEDAKRPTLEELRAISKRLGYRGRAYSVEEMEEALTRRFRDESKK